MTTESRDWTWRDISIVVLVIGTYVFLHEYDRQLAGMALTFPSFILGLVGVVRRRITISGRGGRNPRTYTGWQGVLASLPFLVGGGLLTYWQAVERWPTIFSVTACYQQ